jgi:multiple sugar transport system permease protein
MKNNAKYFFLLPGVVWVLLFTLFPLIYSLYLSLNDVRLGRDPRFVGLENYIEILGLDGEGGDEKARDTAAFTAFLSIGSTTLTLLMGTFIAWVFNHDIPFLRQMRAIITMPLFAAPVALGFLGIILFNEVSGPINNILQGLGLGRVQWFIDPWGARFAVLLIDVWQWTPFVFIVVLAAMQAIPDDLYESARLDTKSSWMQFRYITMPLIVPALGTVMLLRLVETFKAIDVPVSLTRGGPGSVTQTYSYYAYDTGLVGSFQLGDASALAYLIVIVAIIISSIYFSRVSARFE